MNVSIANLDSAIKTELENWANGDLRDAVNNGFEAAAKEAKKKLKQGGPYKERTGKYTKDWDYDVRASRTSAITGLRGYSVYNKKHYQLTHLLEKGHQTRKGGRTKAFEHIGPVNDAIGQIAVEQIQKGLGG